MDILRYGISGIGDGDGRRGVETDDEEEQTDGKPVITVSEKNNDTARV